MALPKLETKTYTLTLPSTGEEIKYRPFLMKEQKILLMAQESEKDGEVIDAMTQLITDCTFEKVEVSVICPDDEETRTDVSVDISKIECNMLDDHSNIVNITDTVKIVFKYPLLSTFKSAKNTKETEMMFKMIHDCVQEIHYGEDVYNKIDMSEKDINDFVESLSTEQFKNIGKFFETMPKLRHVIQVTNPKTKVKGELLLEGLQSFLV